MDKAVKPVESELKETLGASFLLWNQLKNHLNAFLDNPSEEWNYPGKKYGWSFRLKSKKRNIIYFLPGHGFFKVAFVFGQKAFEKVLQSKVKETIKQSLREARQYAEGRGIRIDVNEENDLQDIKMLVQIKLAN